MEERVRSRILVSDPITDDGVTVLRRFGDVDVRTGLGREELLSLIGDYQALVVRSETKVTAEVIDAGRVLQVIGRAGVGVDNIDIQAATRRGIVVVNVPTGNTVSTAEHTIALMLALARRIPQAASALKAGQWQRQQYVGVEVRGKTLGIVGLGKVGSEVARRAAGLEMRVLAVDPFVSADHVRALGIELVSLAQLLEDSDFVCVHTPLTPTTSGLIGKKELALVKRGVYIMNTARGGIIDDDALLAALEDGRVTGAAIDVFRQEPPQDRRLVEHPLVIATPHLGASTAEAQTNVAVGVAEQIEAVLAGQQARYAVNLPLIPPETLAALGPFIALGAHLGKLATQLAEGQLKAITVGYEGEIANLDTSLVKAAIIGGLLEPVSEERVNPVNANMVAASRGLHITERKCATCQNYTNLVVVDVRTSAHTTSVAGAILGENPHIVRVDDYWVDLAPTGGYWLFCDHRDRPGLIGAVGNVTGNADINISSMLVSRLQPRGPALMVLGLDEPISEEVRQQLLAIEDIYTAKLVRF